MAQIKTPSVIELDKHRSPRILAVDDEASILGCLRRELKGESFEVLTAESAQAGLEALRECAEEGRLPAVVVSDYRMPVMNGVDFLELVKERYPNIQRVLLTAYASPRVMEDAINRCEIHRFLSKPWERPQLRTTLLNAVNENRLREENASLLRERAVQNQQLRELNENLEKQVELRTRQLQMAKQEISTTFDAIGAPVTLINGDYVIRRANRALSSHSNMEFNGVNGRKCYEMVTGRSRPCEQCPVPEVKRTGKMQSALIQLPRRDSTFKVAAYPCHPSQEQGESRFVCLYHDITEQERNKEKLLISQKMAALGELAGAVAHEINNPLGGILAFTQIMMRETEKDAEEFEYLELIEDSTRRCQKTVRNLLSYARFSSREERHRVSIADVARKACTIMEHLMAMHNVNAEIVVDDDAKDLLVSINTNDVQGVFFNLFQNATDAMPNGGTIHIHVSVDRSVSPAVVMTRVADEGGGFDESLKTRLFDPYFTTKEEGKGTGLGLSVAYQIVRENEGTLDAECEEGSGAVFVVSFPVVG